MTRLTALGVALLASYAAHVLACATRGHAGEALWACHVGVALMGLGCLACWPTLAAIGSLWLALGTPLWIVELFLGGDTAPTSIVTHCLGFAAFLPIAMSLRWPHGSWWKAVLALGVLQMISRAVTDPGDNVNAAFDLFGRMQTLFPSYLAYEAAAAGVSSAAFYAIERAVVGWQRRTPIMGGPTC